MARALKVYGGVFDGCTRWIVAAPSIAVAARAFGISEHHCRGYSSVTHNADEVRLAHARPGIVLSVGADHRHGGPYIVGKVRHVRGAAWPPKGAEVAE